MDTMSPDKPGGLPPSTVIASSKPGHPGLRKSPAYWYPYTTMCKGRWLGREILEVVSTEFRDRSMEYYRYALESGFTTVNGKVAKPDTVLQNGDRIENVVHRHEPPVTSTPVRILLHDKERQFIVVNKPGSIPVHPSGRYFRHSLSEMLLSDLGFEKIYTVNRLDRLTSGLMIIPLAVDRAHQLTQEFIAGTVKKVYLARCKGKFPDGEVVLDKPLLTVDRQIGLNIVHDEGKNAVTIFNLVRYDAKTDSSVVLCKPQTGRSHQIRVHLQYLGHPIANDPIYSSERIWGPQLGKEGIDINPSDERAPPQPPEHLRTEVEKIGSPESLAKEAAKPTIGFATSGTVNVLEEEKLAERLAASTISDAPTNGGSSRKLLPRETGEDIGMGSPVPLSSQAVGIITRLRNMKDENEDWSRWRDVVFRAKGRLSPKGYILKPPPPQNRRVRGASGELIPTSPAAAQEVGDGLPSVEEVTAPTVDGVLSDEPQVSTSEALEKASASEAQDTEGLYCPECYLPLHPDPKPENLYIFLHALEYTTSLGTFETPWPEWAAEDYEWGS